MVKAGIAALLTVPLLAYPFLSTGLGMLVENLAFVVDLLKLKWQKW